LKWKYETARRDLVDERRKLNQFPRIAEKWGRRWLAKKSVTKLAMPNFGHLPQVHPPLHGEALLSKRLKVKPQVYLQALIYGAKQPLLRNMAGRSSTV
jgi:hypothetical protein